MSLITCVMFAAKCCCEAGIWYYRILEVLVNQEKKRPGIRDISGSLENDLFQCCMVVCCLEVAITSNLLPCNFPPVLQIFRLAAYHFWKVIELVLRAEIGLPHTAVKHLQTVEEKILESLAWTRDSPLWQEIRANGGLLPPCQQVMSPGQLEDPKNTDLHQPRMDLTDQHSPSDVNRLQRSSSFHVFVRKVYILMAKRLRELCTPLDIPEELRLKIWTCFEHSLVHFSDLMIDRHLDQLLMCPIYIIAKVTMVNIPFKRIMNCYKSQPYASKSVCKHVLLSQRGTENDPIGNNNNNGAHRDSIPTPNTPSTHYPGPSQEERGNLIYFYNQIYTTKMQHFAQQFALNSVGDTPPPSPFPRQPNSSPRRCRLSSSHLIFLSPLNPETSSSNTPGLSYFFSSSPSERLREINKMIKMSRSPTTRCREITLDEEEEEGEDGHSAKRLRLDDQSVLQRRLRNVVDDRANRGNHPYPL
ncbi:retinoblastoma-like protein 2 [Scomber japonicus]|uniref:retinoblastoma-like protein 2 n=1 Tax=Scomber japonicus TaxID=13676 RepID=UPI002305EA66|nr:retinoblastoma-like protein 2 [Scomber japonicus]